MHRTKRMLAGAAVTVAAVLTSLAAGPAQGAGDPQEPARAVSASSAADPGQARAPLPGAAGALAKMQARIAEYVAKNGTAYSFASYLDAQTGALVLDTDAPAALVSTLTALPGATLAESQAIAALRLRSTKTTDLFSRRDDTPSFIGGGGIKSGGRLCSSGYTVRNSAGTKFMVTAGHCYADGASVTTEDNNRAYGTVSQRRLPSVTGHPADMELIGGQAYSGGMFTGGVTSSTYTEVAGAAAGTVGSGYCHSGRTSGEQCGHSVIAVNGQVCTESGCSTPVLVFTGGTIPLQGDSGGTLYTDATPGRSITVRGHVTAGSTTTGYAQSWDTVASAYGVSIVPGV
ncbi:hypothetical protein ACK8N7_01335 [Streptomyces griseobrunneus]|uniref:hypothetical protein n=1 Tax=Streptomyces microflavus TaxID=1919 RepID=UPI0038279810